MEDFFSKRRGALLNKKSLIFTLLLVCFGTNSSLAQERDKIEYTSERTQKTEEYPGAFIFSKIEKQVRFTHEGIKVWCDNAIFYDDENFFRAFGNVKMKQGDSITMTSDYAEYDGQTKFAFASNNVQLTTDKIELTTDTLFFNRVKQEGFYRSGGTVRDTASTITSKTGRYFMEEGRFSFLQNVVVNNPDYVINSEHLDYLTESGNAYLYGPSTIDGEKSKIYCERGFYDTKKDKGYFVKNSKVYYQNRILEGDSIYFDREKAFASATNFIKVTDTINESVLRGHYAEVYRDKDSLFITKRALASMKQDKDSIHVHADTLKITGKPEQREVTGFYDVRMYKGEMSGRCDSIFINEKTGVTDMMGKPVMWSGLSQMTGDTIRLINYPETDGLDSLSVFYNAFMVQKDTLERFNQVKGKLMYGIFEDNDLSFVKFIKNTETIQYTTNEKGQYAINKAISSSIGISFEDGEVRYVQYNIDAHNTMSPRENFPENARKLRGFNWRGDERLLKKSDLFKGEPPLDLPKINGIPLPDEESGFFKRKKSEKTLLNDKSRLKEGILKDRPKENDRVNKISKDSIKVDKPKKPSN